ncbi:8964_t:CDS:2, partial [Funneliformis geosporum]
GFQDKAASKIGRIGVGIATDADIIPNGTWDKDWSIAGGEPVDNALVTPNAGGGFPAVTIAPGIKLGQLLYLAICQLSNSPLELKRLVN